MKLCYTCNCKKELNCFHKKSESPDGHCTMCKTCKGKYEKNMYSNNPEWKARKRKNIKSRIFRNRIYVYNILRNSQCVDCGEKRWKVLEFDHVRGKKRDNISILMRRLTVSITILKKEIAKCEVRCCNCHRLKTIERSNSIRNTWEDDCKS